MDKDKRISYKNIDNFSNSSWIDVENEHFIVWMKASGVSPFRKIWGRIN